MDDLRERFRSLDRRLANLDMPDLLPVAETRDVRAAFGRRRHERRLLAPVLIGLLVVCASGIAWAIIGSSATDTVSIDCEIAGSMAGIPSATGDPVADCAAQWLSDTGHLAPPLVAYDTGLGSIAVIPASDPAPSGWQRLLNGTTQNRSMVEMQQWLDDYVGGLNSGCYDDAISTQMTEAALQRLGMADWTVREAPAGDPGQCVDTGILDPSTETVQLRALGNEPTPSAPYEELAAKLRAISNSCQPLDVATRQTQAAAAGLGLSQDAHDYELTRIPDNSASCTTIYEDVGGTIFIVLRGPEG